MTILWAPPDHRAYLAGLFAAFACALVLALMRWCGLSTPRWRLLRALVVAVALSFAPSLWVPELRLSPMGLFEARGPDAWTAVGAFRCVMANGVLLGWLILTEIEGRSLASMGWTRRNAGRYVLLGLCLGGLLSLPNISRVPASAGHPMGRLGFVGALGRVPPSYALPNIASGALAGWSEENVFRGHLLPALTDSGCSGGWGNLLQSGAFALYHVRGDLLRFDRSQRPRSWLARDLAHGQVWRLGWGLLFGFLRLRCRSIVPGFVCHTLVDTFGLALTDVCNAYRWWWATWVREL